MMKSKTGGDSGRKSRALQLFSQEYLKQCQEMSVGDILKFLEEFRLLLSTELGNPVGELPADTSRLISIKIPESLLSSFKTKSKLRGKRYQTLIKELMREWVKSG